MEIREIIDIFEEKHPKYLQEEWDNSGVQVGNIDQEVKNVLLTLEITPESIEEAINNNCNLIICHHPIIFPNIHSIDENHFKGKKIIEAIKNDIVIYASHTATDVSGFNEFIFENMGYKSQGKIVKTSEEYGYGSFADVDENLDKIIKKIKDNLSLCKVLVYGEDIPVKRIGLVTGSGMDFIQEAIDAKIDLFITGDITHHDAMDAMEQGVTLVDIGHEGSEGMFADFVEELFSNNKKLSEIKTFKYYNDQKYLRRVV
ncbi:Nif3-like dinuclear metal center hexameric protein [Helcococcus kunzii]|uniref:Nif3-like dinuclear metal center hexameric protein n=1 Tax=Helcococcus kunzii TaxID=40091 RepID=UPI0024ACE604|nr:Nif3-like dinuclear metal center hexameric protein [Helcococcus kunzii]